MWMLAKKLSILQEEPAKLILSKLLHQERKNCHKPSKCQEKDWKRALYFVSRFSAVAVSGNTFRYNPVMRQFSNPSLKIAINIIFPQLYGVPALMWL